MRPLVGLGALLLLIGCVSVPKICEPILPGNNKMALFTGSCRKLVIRGEDYTADCQAKVLLYDPEKGRRAFVFFLEDPKEIFTFEGKPFSVDLKSKRFDVKVTRRAERSALFTETPETKETGSCDLIPRDARSYLIKCQVTDAKGLSTYAEFATAESNPHPCQEDLKERPIGAF